MTKSKMNMSKILFEKDESEFSFKDETDSDTEETPDTEETDSDTEETDSDTEEALETSNSADTVDDLQFKVLSNSLESMTSSIDNLTSDDAIIDIQNFVSSNLDESLYYNKSIGNILLSEKSSLELKNMEKEIDIIDRVLSKGSELVKNFKNPSPINIDQYVEVGLNAYKNFDSLFKKENFIKQAIKNLLVLNSGSDAEKNIKEFEEMFHKELYNKFNIEYQDFQVNVKKKDVASGAFNKG